MMSKLEAEGRLPYHPNVHSEFYGVEDMCHRVD
jgi:hypothetical protein